MPQYTAQQLPPRTKIDKKFENWTVLIIAVALILEILLVAYVIYRSGKRESASTRPNLERVTTENKFEGLVFATYSSKSFVKSGATHQGFVFSIYTATTNGYDKRPVATEDTTKKSSLCSPRTGFNFKLISPAKLYFECADIKEIILGDGQVQKAKVSIADTDLVSPDGAKIAKEEKNGQVKIVDLASGKTKAFRAPASIPKKYQAFFPLAWSLDSKFVYFTNSLKKVSGVWKLNLVTGEMIKTFGDPVSRNQIVPLSTQALLGNSTTLRVVDFNSGSTIKEITVQHPLSKIVSVDPDVSRVIYTSSGSTWFHDENRNSDSLASSAVDLCQDSIIFNTPTLQNPANPPTDPSVTPKTLSSYNFSTKDFNEIHQSGKYINYIGCLPQ